MCKMLKCFLLWISLISAVSTSKPDAGISPCSEGRECDNPTSDENATERIAVARSRIDRQKIDDLEFEFYTALEEAGNDFEPDITEKKETKCQLCNDEQLTLYNSKIEAQEALIRNITAKLENIGQIEADKRQIEYQESFNKKITEQFAAYRLQLNSQESSSQKLTDQLAECKYQIDNKIIGQIEAYKSQIDESFNQKIKEQLETYQLRFDLQDDSIQELKKQLAVYKSQIDEQDKLYRLQIESQSATIRIITAEYKSRFDRTNENLDASNKKIEHQNSILEDKLNGLQRKFETIPSTSDNNNKLTALELAVNSANVNIDYLLKFHPPTSCLRFGNITGIRSIKAPGIFQPFLVACDSRFAGPGWTVIMRRQNGSVNFNRSWFDYKNGFGDLEGDFWLGLERLHRLTASQPHELYVMETYENEHKYLRYDSFEIGNERGNYQLKSLGNFTGNTLNRLRYHKDKKFTTRDRDNYNCFYNYVAAGWWIGYSCTYSSLYTDINWLNANRIKSVQLMIRPISYD